MTINRRIIAVGIGILISAIFLWLAFRNLSPEQFIGHIQQVNVAWLIIGAVTYFAAVTVIALRWQFLLRAIQVVPLRALTPLVAIGYMGNNVYPFRTGEVLRIFLLTRNHDVPVARATTTVIVERVFDGLVMLSFIFVALLLVDIESADVQTVVNVAAPIFLLAMLVFFILAAQPNLLRRLVTIFSKRLPGRLSDIVTDVSEDIIAGLEGLRTPLHLLGTIVSSFVTWGIEAGVYWMVMWAFNLDYGYPVALLVVGTVNLAGLLPASPGMVGVYEFFAIAILVATGLDQDRAAAYAIVVHIVIWLPVTLVGFYFLARQGLGWSAITHAGELETNVSAE